MLKYTKLIILCAIVGIVFNSKSLFANDCASDLKKTPEQKTCNYLLQAHKSVILADRYSQPNEMPKFCNAIRSAVLSKVGKLYKLSASFEQIKNTCKYKVGSFWDIQKELDAAIEKIPGCLDEYKKRF